MLSERAKENNVIVTYTNTIGGQDELVFDGQSMVIDQRGKLIASGKQFEEELLTVDIKVPALLRTLTQKAPAEQRKKYGDLVDFVAVSHKPSVKRKPLPPTRPAVALSVCEEVLPCPCARDEGLFAQERIQGRGHRALGRH